MIKNAFFSNIEVIELAFIVIWETTYIWNLLNHVFAILQPVHAWLLKFAFVCKVGVCVCVCVCVCAHLWGYNLHSHDIEPV